MINLRKILEPKLQKIIRFDFATTSCSSFTRVPGNFSLLIFDIFFLDFSKMKIFFAYFFFAILFTNEDPNNPQPMMSTFFIN